MIIYFLFDKKNKKSCLHMSYNLLGYITVLLLRFVRSCNKVVK